MNYIAKKSIETVLQMEWLHDNGVLSVSGNRIHVYSIDKLEELIPSKSHEWLLYARLDTDSFYKFEIRAMLGRYCFFCLLMNLDQLPEYLHYILD